MMGILGVAVSLSAQTPTSRSDADQISALMASLSDHSKAPADVLDPSLSPSDREKNLHHFSAPHYELSLVPTQGIPVVIGDSASVPVRVHFNAEDGNSLDASATAQFVRRNGIWYFSNFNFMSWPAFLIVALVVCILVGIGYAATVLVLRSKLLKRGPLGASGIKMFIPFFWPTLFSRTR
jgi:hypothetical protein